MASKLSPTQPQVSEFEMSDRKTTQFAVDEQPADMAIEKGISDDDDDHGFEGTKSTADDKLDMQRLGKKQQLIVGRKYTYWTLQRQEF